MHDSTTLQQKLDDHTRTMLHRPDGTVDIYACEARAWMFAGMVELLSLTTDNDGLINWLDSQEVALIELANRERRKRWVR